MEGEVSVEQNEIEKVEESTEQENEKVSTDQSDDTMPIEDPKPKHSPSSKDETVSTVTAEEGVVSDEEDERPIDRRRQRKGGGASDSEEDSEGETPNEDNVEEKSKENFKPKAIKEDDEWEEPKDNGDWAESKDDRVSNNEEPVWVESKEGAKAEPKSKEKAGSSEGAEDTRESPMFVPKGRFYFHDSRFDPEGKEEEGEKDKKLPIKPSQVIEKWEHDMYEPEKQKPRSEMEKERDRKYYEELDQRRASGEPIEDRGSGRGNRGTRLGQYIPRRQPEGERGRRSQGDYPRRNNDRDNAGRRGNETRERDRNEGARRSGPRTGGDRYPSRGDGRGRREGSGPRQQSNRGKREEEWGDEERGSKRENNLTGGKNSTNDTKQRNKDSSSKEDWDHKGSLFIGKNSADSNDVFTSKVFSLSSQTNKLIVKDASPDLRKSYGRGRGRVLKSTAYSSPGGLTGSTPSAPTNQKSVVKETVKTTATVGEDKKEESIPMEGDKDGASKPKRYSSRRQKPGEGGDGLLENPEGVVVNSNPPDNLPPAHLSHPHPFPPPYQWPGFTPMMLDPLAQQQQMMLMMQQMAMYQHMMYADGTPAIPGTAPPMVSMPHPPDGPVPASNGDNSEDPKTSAAGLFVPALPLPDQQMMGQSPKGQQKHSQAIPIVSPRND